MQVGIIDGLINGTWKLRDYHLVEGSATRRVVFDVSGRASKRYKLLAFIKNAGTGSDYAVLFNGDGASAAYGFQRMLGNGSIAHADSSAGPTAGSENLPVSGITANNVGAYVADIFKTDSNVVYSAFAGYDANVSTINKVEQTADVWNNSADITSIAISSSLAGQIAVGSFFVLLEQVEVDGMRAGKLNANQILNTIELVDEYEVEGSAETSFSFTGLNGDTDKIWLLSEFYTSSVANATVNHRFNNDTGLNYHRQYLRGGSSTVEANRATLNNFFNMEMNAKIVYGNSIIFALSGNIRLMLCEYMSEANSSAVGNIMIEGACWTNTADEITSIDITSDATSGFGVGTKVSLYKIEGL